MLLGILSIIALLVIGWYFGSQKILSDAEERVISAWGALDRAYQQLENLAAAMLEHAVLSSETAEKTKRAWQQSVELLVNPNELKGANVRRYQERKVQLCLVLGEWITIRESRHKPNQQSFEQETAQFQENKKIIINAIERYNGEVTRYNKLVHRFPFSLLNFSEKPLYPSDLKEG